MTRTHSHSIDTGTDSDDAGKLLVVQQLTILPDWPTLCKPTSQATYMLCSRILQTVPALKTPDDCHTQVIVKNVSLTVLLNDTMSSMPNFCFSNLLEKTLNMCEELKNMNATNLIVRDKRGIMTLAII